MSNKSSLFSLAELVTSAGLIGIMAALAMPGLGAEFTATRWVFTGSAAVNLLGRLGELRFRPESAGEPLRVKRLLRLQLWSAIFFAVAAVMQWLRTAGEYDWIAFTLAGAVVIIYTNIALVRARKASK